MVEKKKLLIIPKKRVLDIVRKLDNLKSSETFN